MKHSVLVLSLLLSTFSFSQFSSAQTASIKDIPADGDTTVTVSKGKTSQVEYQVVDGTGDIQGEPDVLTRNARSSWKKACTDWKQEMKELNKDNHLIALSCATPKCAKNEALEYTCASTGSFKVKTKVK